MFAGTNIFHRENLVVNISDLPNIKIFQENNLFHPEMTQGPSCCFKDTKNTSLLTFNSLKQKKLRCFDTVFQRPYRYFSIALKVVSSLSDRYKIFTSDWLWIEICEKCSFK